MYIGDFNSHPSVSLLLSPNHCLCVSTTKIGMNPPNMNNKSSSNGCDTRLPTEFSSPIFQKSTRELFLGKRFFTFDQIKSSAPHVVRVYRAANVKEN